MNTSIVPLLATLADPASVLSVAFHPTANPPLLATGSMDTTVKLWLLSPDNSSATCVASLKHSSDVRSVAFHPTAPFLATGSCDNTVKLWLLSSDNSSATCVATLDKSNRGHSGPVESVTFHPTAPLLATGGGDKTVKLWDCRHLTNRGQLAIALGGFTEMPALLAKRLVYDPSAVHPRLAFKTNLLEKILATTRGKSLDQMFESTVADRVMQYLSHRSRAPSMPVAIPQFSLQLTLPNGSPKSPKRPKSPKDSKGGSRRRKSNKAKTLKIKNKNNR